MTWSSYYTSMNNQIVFLQLVRLGIGHHAGSISGEINWDTVQALAERQGLSAIVLDGIEKLPKDMLPQQGVLLNWIGEVMQAYEQRYTLYVRAITELAGFYNEKGYKMMVLKGYACGLNWPRPEHRPYGDIDIWQFGQQIEADKALKEKGIKVDNSHHHHTVFYWHDFMVENHYDFINVYHHKSNKELEKIFQDLGRVDSFFIEVQGVKVFLPSANLHAIFLLKHAMSDFASFSVTLRQIMDWGFHVEKHGKEIDWEWLYSVLERFHMMDFFNTINAICVEDLGFDASIFHTVQFNPILKERVLEDILNPKYSAQEPRHFLHRLVFKYKRWRGNAWKHQMCYNETLWSAFWSGVWSHIIKPSSI